MQTLEAEDLTDRMVKFFPIETWNNSEDNEVEYILPNGYGMKFQLRIYKNKSFNNVIKF
jgi:hypothetical protein